MSEENKIGTYQFVAEPFHVDFNGRLTMGVLGNHLLTHGCFPVWRSSWMRCLTNTRSSRFRHG